MTFKSSYQLPGCSREATRFIKSFNFFRIFPFERGYFFTILTLSADRTTCEKLVLAYCLSLGRQESESQLCKIYKFTDTNDNKNTTEEKPEIFMTNIKVGTTYRNRNVRNLFDIILLFKHPAANVNKEIIPLTNNRNVSWINFIRLPHK